MKRYLGLDIGDRTIGVAVSDLLGLTAQGVETIRRKNLARDIARLGELMQQYETRELVSGYPKNMNGSEGERCEVVRSFIDEVKKIYPDIHVMFWDERLSTVAATRSLLGRISRGGSGKRSSTRWRRYSSCRDISTASVDKARQRALECC